MIHEHPVDRGIGAQLGVLNPPGPGRDSAATVFLDEVTSVYWCGTSQNVELLKS